MTSNGNDNHKDKEENEISVNPCPPTWLNDEESALLRGDAIGDTAYTHRWVLTSFFNIMEALPTYLKVAQSPEQNEEKNGNEDDNTVIELETAVEDSTCQLWDMTVERDVVLHILALEEIDIFPLSSLIIEQSRAPRLTEVMVGVLANICCQEEGCIKLLEEKENCDVLPRLMHLVSRTSDVPTLVEVFRLLRLLLWHRRNRTPKSTFATCPLIKILCQDLSRNAITFILQNSLSDQLVVGVLELLSSLLYVCLPETNLQVASLFSQSDLINCLVDILKLKGTSFDPISEEDLKIVTKIILVLYAFIDTPGTTLIQKNAESNPEFESIVVAFIEYLAKVETPQELTQDICDQLCAAIGLCQLLISQMKIFSFIMIVGRLLAVIHGQTHQYTVSRSNSADDSIKDSNEALAVSVNEQRRRRSSEKMDLEFTQQKLIPSDDFGKSSKSDVCNSESVQMLCGWMSPSAVELATRSQFVKKDPLPTTTTVEESIPNSAPEVSTPVELKSSPNEPDSPVMDENVSNLLESLEDYCFHLIAWWWSSHTTATSRNSFQNHIFDTLDQCHAHEVVFILDAVRKKNRLLVPMLQEQLLDSGNHLRLVAILAHMYQ